MASRGALVLQQSEARLRSRVEEWSACATPDIGEIADLVDATAPLVLATNKEPHSLWGLQALPKPTNYWVARRWRSAVNRFKSEIRSLKWQSRLRGQ